MARWIRFFLAIAVGVAGGLIYGWWLNPVEYINTTPDTLRVDYRSDYVLMVAEIYSVEGDAAMAARRLGSLGNTPPAEIVREAVLFAESQGYADADVDLLHALEVAMQGWTPALGTSAP